MSPHQEWLDEEVARFVRGCRNGLLLSLPIWIGIILLANWWWGA